MFEFDKLVKNKKITLETYSKSDLTRVMKITRVFANIIVIVKNLIKSKHLFLANFIDDLDKFNKLKTV